MDYKNLDKISAQNFLDVCEECGVKKVIYLGGLGVKNEHTSKHLLSRIETGEVLSSSKKVQCIWIRAGVIIGSGSTSFEIIRNLTEKLPIMTTPKWVYTKAQPIAVDDVFNKIAVRYKENDFSVWLNGVQVHTDTSGIEPVGLNTLSFDFGSNTLPFYGKTKMVATFPYLSNDEMECLTGEGYGTFEALAAAYSYTIK